MTESEKRRVRLHAWVGSESPKEVNCTEYSE